MKKLFLILFLIFCYSPTHIEAADKTRYLDPVFSKYTVERDILYGSAPKYQSTINQNLYLDLYQPTGDIETKRPAIIWIHGGGFMFGSKSVYDLGGHALGPIYAKLGYVSLAIDYRVVDRNLKINDPEGPVIIAMAKDDALAAVRWVRAHADAYHIDPDKIIVAGHSSGAVIALYAAYDTLDVGKSGTPNISSVVAAAVSISGAMFPENVNTIQAGDPPAILLHGELDKLVSYSYAQAVEARLTAVSIPHLLYQYPNVNHDLMGATDAQPNIIKFLYTQLNLGNAPAPGDLTPTDDTVGDQVNLADFRFLQTGFGTTYSIFDYNSLVANFGQ